MDDHLSGWWLSPTPLKNMSSSVGMMTFPTVSGKSFKIPWFQSPPTTYEYPMKISMKMGFIPERWEKTEENQSTAFGDGWNPTKKKNGDDLGMVQMAARVYHIIWIYMDLYGFVWIYIYGLVWVFFDISSLVL